MSSAVFLTHFTSLRYACSHNTYVCTASTTYIHTYICTFGASAYQKYSHITHVLLHTPQVTATCVLKRDRDHTYPFSAYPATAHTHADVKMPAHLGSSANPGAPVILRKATDGPLQGFFLIPGIIVSLLLDKLITELEKQKSNSHPLWP